MQNQIIAIHCKMYSIGLSKVALAFTNKFTHQRMSPKLPFSIRTIAEVTFAAGWAGSMSNHFANDTEPSSRSYYARPSNNGNIYVTKVKADLGSKAG